jgi:phosphate acetyltransferase
MIENRTFDEITPGDSASLVRTLSKEDIELFAVISGDVNPAHVDEEFARSDVFHKIIAHGMWGASLISTLLGTKLPGPGTIYLSQTLGFHHPVVVGDTIAVTITATAKETDQHRVRFDCQCMNQRGEVVMSGSAEVIAPTDKVKRPRTTLPEVRLHDHGVWYRHLISLAAGLPPIRTAVVDGPLAFDNAVSPGAARTKGIISPVAGQADILVVPDLEAGNMLVKQLVYLADAELAGIVLGARVPIILTSRADSPRAHMASCALALLVAQSKRKAQR